MSNLIGQSLGHYHLLEQLGEGGMATVYKAYDTRLERDVAVKIIRRGLFGEDVLERMLKRFEREAKALARLTHPNIVPVIDYGEHEGAPYLVMPYLPGGTLKQRLGTLMPWQEAVRILLPIAQALDYAHEQNIIHRDIKPSNILLTKKGQPMLSDFGIAKILESEDTQTLTGTGAGVGTPEYMAPEQWTGQATKQSDIYSLGVVLYELVTGRKPYTADTPAAILLKQASEPLPRPAQFVAGLPEAVEKMLFKALARKSEDRYADMAAFGLALENLLVGQSQTFHTGANPSAPRPRMEDSRATIVQEATRDELPPASSAPVGQSVPASLQRNLTNPPRDKKRTWWPWVAGAGGLVAQLGIGLAMGGGLLKMGQQGQGPLAALATDTRTPTSTTTPTHTPSKTPTFTITQTPSFTFTIVSTRTSSITPSYTPFPTSARVHITIWNSASNPRYVFVDGVQVAYVNSGSSAVFAITAGAYAARACTDAAGSSCGNTKGFTWYFNNACSIDWGDEMIYCH
jgi:serine/threonine protein kinase